MADPKLQSAWLRLEYSVLDLVNGGDPLMESVLFPLARVDVAQQNPSQAVRQDIVLALNRVVVPGADTQYAYWRKTSDISLSFDNDVNRKPLHAMCKLVFSLRDGISARYSRVVSFPVQIGDAVPFQQAAELPPQIDLYVRKVIQAGTVSFEMLQVIPPGGPAAPQCDGCSNANRSPEKEAQCATRGCYGKTPTTPQHYPEGV